MYVFFLATNTRYTTFSSKYVKVELTFQRIRDNSLRPNRTPTWLRKAGLVKEERGVYKDRKWADRYVNASRPVQYDEDGHAHYLDEDEEEPLESDTNMLVDPDRFFEGDRSRRIRKQKARVDDESEEFYPSSSPPQATFSAGPPRGSKSLGARTRRFFGMHGRASSATDTYPEPMNRHYRISSAMGDMDVPTSHKSLTDREDPDDEFRSSPAWPSSSDATSYDDLDRELMGLSTQENFPPVRGSRRQPRFGGPSRSHIPSSPAQPSDLEPQRDVLDFEHTF